MAIESKYRVYEAMFLVDSGDAASWDDMTKHLSTIVTRNGAEIIGMTRWDERKLTFTVKGRKRGTYVLAFFMLTSGVGVSAIEHDCRLSEKVIRTLVLKADHFTVADMRVQIGEDIHEDTARKLMADRQESETLAPVVTKPARAPEMPDESSSDSGERGGFDRRRGGGRDRY
jgi:small subunit ribosomal protein S6